MKWFCLLLVIQLNLILCKGQGHSNNDEDLSRIVEELIAFQDLDADYEQLYENLMQMLANPVDLNKVTAEELRTLHLLSESQITQFFKYRDQQGDLVSIYELQAIPEFDLHTIQELQRWTKVVDPNTQVNRSILKRIAYEKNNYLITRYERTLEQKKGFGISDDPEKHFEGSEDKMYLRFRSSKPGDFSIGFTAEKDAGERFTWNRKTLQYGFDFSSYHIHLQNKRRLKNLIIGDFQCQYAQGLVLGGAFGLGKGAETITTVRRSNVGLLPYSSVNESGFYRGAGTTYQLNRNLFITGFYSAIKRDASTSDDSSGYQTISSFQYTGLHRNATELNKRKKITENNYGAVLNYKRGSLDAGVIFHAINFSEPVNKQASAYNQFTFNGQENITVGSFLNYAYSNFNFFSEAAKSVDGGSGIIAGILSALHQNLDVSVVFRKYDRNFYTFYANAFAENSLPQNETGFYWGWKYHWKRKYGLSGYTDLFKFPWLGFRRYAPAQGHEWLMRFSYQPSRHTLLYIQAREESKLRNGSEDSNLYQPEPVTKRNYWFSATYNVTDNLKLKTRAQFNTFSTAATQSKGVVLLQDLSYSAGKFQISTRYAIFDSEDFENRHYVYENDAWLAFSMPAYFGVGTRNYILVEYKISQSLSVWIRYARTRYIDRNTIGSGVDAIEGNIKNDVKFQALFRF